MHILLSQFLFNIWSQYTYYDQFTTKLRLKIYRGHIICRHKQKWYLFPRYLLEIELAWEVEHYRGITSFSIKFSCDTIHVCWAYLRNPEIPSDVINHCAVRFGCCLSPNKFHNKLLNCIKLSASKIRWHATMNFPYWIKVLYNCIITVQKRAYQLS